MCDTKTAGTEALVIRDFRGMDYPALVELWEETGVSNPARGDSLESIERTLEARGRLLLAVAEGELVGSVWLTDDARRLYVHHMAVSPERQGEGIGSRLLEAAITLAAQRGLQMKLEVHRDNEVAIGLYRSHGFERIGDYDVMLKRDTGEQARS